ncbi:hypothetical protein PAPH110629_18195 [Paenibacillus phoenicis]
MSKRGTRKEKLQTNYIKKGRGQGVGENYQPFIQAHDNKIASEGWLARHKGWKTKRIHHTLSEHERKYLYYCEWLDGVTDIRKRVEPFGYLRIQFENLLIQKIDMREHGFQHDPLVGTHVSTQG